MPAVALSRVVESGPDEENLAAGAWRRLEALPDPRSPQGRVYPLACLARQRLSASIARRTTLVSAHPGRRQAPAPLAQRDSTQSDVTHSSRTTGRRDLWRGPVRGPGHRIIPAPRVPSMQWPVLSVQLACAVSEAILLIIRRSWVRAPPTPPAVLLAVSAVPWTDVGGAIHPAVIAVRLHRVAVERVWRAKVYGGKDWTGCLPGSPRVFGTEQCVLPPAGSPGMTRRERPRPRVP